MKKYIALIDSGIGGLSVLIKILKSFPNENYIYIGDNKNAPYGNKSIRELKMLTLNNLILLNDYKIKFLIVACNTLSCNLLTFIKGLCNFPVFGVFPPIEKSLIKNEKVILISTVATAKRYNYKEIKKLPQKYLTSEIENNLFSLSAVKIDGINRPLYQYSRVILGCTHYNFIKKNIFDHFGHINLSCSEDYIVEYILKHSDIKKSLVKYRINNIKFLGSGKEVNRKFYSQVVKNNFK